MDESQPQSYSPIFKALHRMKNLQASSEWVATYLSISSRHSPLWIHSASNKIQTALQTKSCSSPLARSCPEHSGCRGWQGLMLFSSLLCFQHTLELTDLSVISYFRAHSQRDPVHTLVWLCLQSKLKLNTDQSEMAGAHSPHWTADSGQMIHHLTISHTCEDGRCKLKFMPLWTPLISTSSACLCLNKDFTRDPLAVISPVETGCFSKAGTGVGWYCKNTVKS